MPTAGFAMWYLSLLNILFALMNSRTSMTLLRSDFGGLLMVFTTCDWRLVLDLIDCAIPPPKTMSLVSTLFHDRVMRAQKLERMARVLGVTVMTR